MLLDERDQREIDKRVEEDEVPVLEAKRVELGRHVSVLQHGIQCTNCGSDPAQDCGQFPRRGGQDVSICSFLSDQG